MKQIESGAFVVRVSETPGEFTVLRGYSVVARGSYIAGALKLQQTGGDCPSKGAVIEALQRIAGTYVAPAASIPAAAVLDRAIVVADDEPTSDAERDALMESKAELRAMASRRRAKKNGEE